eukprot:16220501-Heterocapsa_arctica.AAC.1
MELMAAVNLEYPPIALKVRQKYKYESVFSLDDVEVMQLNSKQKKIYEREWIACTSVGEMMFQADYHLIEPAHHGHEEMLRLL